MKLAFRATAVECFKAEVRAVDFKTKVLEVSRAGRRRKEERKGLECARPHVGEG